LDIGVWLRGLGLGQYEQLFRDNDVDSDLLPQLSAEDLKEIGVASFGHRRRIAEAIAALPEGSELTSVSGASSGPESGAEPQTGAERRQLTVMFVDLVGSSGLAEGLDPEDLRVAVRSYQDACAGVVARFGGFVAKYLGDGVLAYFGWPRTREDEAQQAVQAGLAVVEAVAELRDPGGRPLAARVGIATGLVVVGDLLGEGAAREEAVVGETPNLAARLQQLADPSTVVVADATRRLLGGLFEAEDLGKQPVRGFAAPVQVWRVLSERQVEGRFEAQRAGAGLTPLVGRGREIGHLLEHWELAAGGEGQVVLLAGEPGIGKSRIVEALRERLGDAPHRLLRYQCSPQHTGSALYPVIARLEHAASFRREDGVEARLAKLEDLLRREIGENGVPTLAPLFAALLEIPPEERYPPLGLTPQQRKAKTLEALARQLEALASRQPVLLVFEDLHWADPTSLELLGNVADRIERLPVLAVLTFRPEFALPSWTGRAHATLLSLNRLGRREAATLVERVAGGKALPAEIQEQILARTDGVPLFVEELTRAVLEAGGPVPQVAIPSTLHDSLMARLDRLTSVKEVAQLAACLGREFSHEMLLAVSPLAADVVETALERLAASGLIHRRGLPPAALYAFRHALVQEAAYQSLLRSRRRELHAHIARTVEAQFPEIAARQPEWVAYHCTEAGLTGPASAYWLEAAHRAKAAYDLGEASTHLKKCLEVLAPSSNDDPQAAEFRARRLEALVLLGDVASLTGDLEGSNQHYERALELSSDLEASTWIGNKLHRPRVAVRGEARIAYYEHGGGEDTLLFVSPLAYGLAAIQPILERLCQEFRIVTVDARGSGASDPLTRPYPLDEHLKDVRAVIAALGDRPLVGIGVSASGNLLLKLAATEPRLFTKLVTIGALTGTYPSAFDPSSLDKMRHLDEQDEAQLIRFHVELVFSEPEMRELRELTIRSRLLLPRETILSFFDLDPGKNIMPLLADIRVPVLVTHGREDRLVPYTAAEQIAAGLPNAQLHAFEGKGHLPIFTATDEFCEVLRYFVRTGSTRP
jgi:class 3 adenylate cyclase/pimeloyl-ACP methyl ester carboxylesterase